MVFPITAKFGDEAEGDIRYLQVIALTQKESKTSVTSYGEGIRNDIIEFKIPYKINSVFNAMVQSKANDEPFVDLTDKTCEKLVSEGELKPSSSSQGLFGKMFG